MIPWPQFAAFMGGFVVLAFLVVLVLIVLARR